MGEQHRGERHDREVVAGPQAKQDYSALRASPLASSGSPMRGVLRRRVVRSERLAMDGAVAPSPTRGRIKY